MKSYKEPPFQDRVGRAADAKRKALDQHRAKPALDERTVAARVAAGLRREAAATEKRVSRKAAEQAAMDEKIAAAAERASIKPPLTEAERKAARDARYAARKNRR
jgi:hypothetical protein